MFKVGDIVKGLNNCDSDLIRYGLLEGQVIELVDNNESMIIEVLKHSINNNIGIVFKDFNSDACFELVNKEVEEIDVEDICSLLDEFNNNELKGKEHDLNVILNNKEDVRRRFANLIRQETEIRCRIEELKSGNNFKNKAANKILEELKLVQEDAKCEKVEIKDGTINFYTTQLYIEDEKYPEGHFKMNKYQIVVNLRELTTKVFGLLDEYKRNSCWSDHCPHPHVSNSGSPCWGNTEAMLVDSMENKELYTTFMLVINFLETFNIDDVAGKRIKNWDFVSKDDDNKILENPYTLYSKELACGCDIEDFDEDDIYDCSHSNCNNSVCCNCYSYCDECNDYFCEDHTRYIESVDRTICNECLTEFYTYVNDLDDYVPDENSFTCDICDEPFSDEAKNSYTRNDGEYITCCDTCYRDCHYVCEHCGEYIEDGEEVYIESEDIYICESCKDEDYTYVEDLNVYVRNENAFECEHCKDYYSNKVKKSYTRNDGEYITCCEECYEDYRYICEDCGDDIADGDETYIKSKKIYVCESCKDDYTYVEDLDEYIPDDEAFECDDCGLNFSNDVCNPFTNNSGDVYNYCNNCFEAYAVECVETNICD